MLEKLQDVSGLGDAHNTPMRHFITILDSLNMNFSLPMSQIMCPDAFILCLIHYHSIPSLPLPFLLSFSFLLLLFSPKHWSPHVSSPPCPLTYPLQPFL